LLLGASFGALSPGGGLPDAPANDAFAPRVAPVLARHCVECHGTEDPAGDLDLERFENAWQARAEPELWSRVREVLREGEMPPKSAASRPDAAEIHSVLEWIAGELGPASPEPARRPGRTTLRRLNRFEYRMAVLDLCGVDYPTRERFPADGVSHGFDVIGETLSLPPLLFERLLEAAEEIAREALPEPGSVEFASQRFSARELVPGEHNEYVPGPDRLGMYSNGQASAVARVSRSGEYALRVWASAQQAGPEPARLWVSIDGARLERFDVTAPLERPAAYEARTLLVPGEHQIALAFVNDFYDPQASDPEQRDRNLYLSSLELVGPLDDLPLTPFQARFLHPDEESEGGARRALTRLARLAWRAPIQDGELDELLALAPPDAGERARLREALMALLVSPRFLFRVEPEPDAPVRDLDGYELATRLAAFLWSSLPDEELLEQAEGGGLARDGLYHGQILRMLRDARSSRLAEGFAAGWLQLERLELAVRDPARFPAFDEELRDAMRRECELFFETLLREDRPVSELLEADFTYANERLARHYGLVGVKGPALRRVPIPEHLRGRRGGLLGQAALLTATSHAARTSPVLRGKWVLEALLAAPPPPPPPGVGALEDGQAAASAAPIRERLERHRSDPSCAACHAPMDGLGFALENYDATGAWREMDGDFAIDATGRLPGEAPILGPEGLRRRLQEDGAFLRGFVRQLATFALGRALAPGDRDQVEALLQGLPSEPTLGAVLHAVCDLPAFRSRHREEGALQ
jgi:mono/diheme cytochrome c family protein